MLGLGLSACLDGEKWKERKGKEKEGANLSCLGKDLGEGRGGRRREISLFYKHNLSKNGEIWRENETFLPPPFPSFIVIQTQCKCFTTP